MGLGLKDAIEQTAEHHQRDTNKLSLPDNYWHPGFITVLAAYVNHHRITENNCTFTRPGYMQAINMHGALWGEDQYQQERLRVGTNYSLVTALNNVEAVDIATGSINSCVRQLAFPGKGRTDYPKGLTDLTHVIGELHDNVWSHGKSTGFSFAQRSAVPLTQRKEHYLEFSLADYGLGFLKELRRAGISGILSHKDAIAWCIQKGHSSKHADLQDDWAQQLPQDFMGGSMFGSGVAVKEKENNHQGLGLYHLMKLVKTYNGQLQLATGNVCLEAIGDEVTYTQLKSEWPGVAISCRFKIHELAVDKDNEENDPQLMEIMQALGGE
ncbi:hypothetical protein [Klebsiella pneumoniae]|uniref:hypothetical protein n=1 Tax=Klebsiella pneumoniae TaxID=573 RepID=UPI00237FE304|nr:hypothetical protein [Klebsiella pneumoniae]MDE4625874.1 hypothetical protein [Klebsiella pneumoniae]